MNIFSFSTDKDATLEFKYKVLVYPNITWAKDLSKDSFVIVAKSIIDNMARIRSDIHWTILLPHELPIFNLPNVTQKIYNLPTYPNQMRCHFDTKRMLEIIDWENNDFDIVYSHLPEHTLQLKNLFYNLTNLRPKFIGYSHWTEFPDVTEYEKTVIDMNFLGLLEMDECGINTEAQKDLVLTHSKTHLSRGVTKKLDQIVVPQYLGWEIPQYDVHFNKMLTIVFNHRPNAYKNYPWFLKQMDELYKKYQHFRVWVPLAETPDREYIYVGNNATRKEYLTHLSACYVGVCGKQKYAGWSVSATDGLSVGVPYLFSDDDYYHELAWDAGIYYKSDEDFQKKIEEFVMDAAGQHRKPWSKKSLQRFNDCTWDKAIVPINEMFDRAIKSFVVPKEKTETFDRIASFIEREKSVSKSDILKHLNWGIRIPWAPYRNQLRNDDRFRFTKDRYEFVG